MVSSISRTKSKQHKSVDEQYCQTLIQHGYYSTAEKQLLQSSVFSAQFMLVDLYRQWSRFDDALSVIAKILSKNTPPDITLRALEYGAKINYLVGDMKQALSGFEQVLAMQPLNLTGISFLLAHDLNNAYLGGVIPALNANTQDADTCYVLGDYYRKKQQYELSMQYYKQGGTIRKKETAHYSDDQRYMYPTHKQLDPLIASTKVTVIAGPRPIFIMGLPRSGSTLIESIVQMHPDISAAGELKHISHLLRQLHMSKLTDSTALSALAIDYKNALMTQHQSPYVIDKMPQNIIVLPILYAAFPDAKFIITERHPLDNLLSAFFSTFSTGSNPWIYDLSDLAIAYQHYSEMIDDWKTLLPNESLHFVKYENLVHQPLNQMNSIFDYLDLTCQPEFLDFHQHKRQVTTSSVGQVRKPISTSSVGMWENYSPYTQILIETLKEKVNEYNAKMHSASC